MGTVTAIRHVAFEDCGILAPLLAARGHRLTRLDAPRDELAPALDSDLLIVLGGPISANDTLTYPFVQEEIALVARRLRHGAPVLGLCLGAQIMARALGAAVGPAPRKEIGWAPITQTAAGRDGVLAPLDGLAVLHWHGENCAAPEGARVLAETAICPVQGFAVGDYGLALQFHPEVTAAGLEAWYVGHCVEIDQTPGIDVARLRGDAARYAPALREASEALFGGWLDAAGL